VIASQQDVLEPHANSSVVDGSEVNTAVIAAFIGAKTSATAGPLATADGDSVSKRLVGNEVASLVTDADPSLLEVIPDASFVGAGKTSATGTANLIGTRAVTKVVSEGVVVIEASSVSDEGGHVVGAGGQGAGVYEVGSHASKHLVSLSEVLIMETESLTLPFSRSHRTSLCKLWFPGCRYL